MKQLYLKLLFITILLSLLTLPGITQNIAITDDESYTSDPSAMLDVKSLTKGLLVPRLTATQRNAIASPATGLLVFDTDVDKFYFYDGAEWNNLSAEGIWLLSGNNLYLSDENKRVGIGVSNVNSKLEVKADASFGVNDTLFVVKDNAGYPVFAVFSDGAKVFVDQTTKGKIGGFAVSGRTSTKFTEEDYFHVTPDSTRITFNDAGKGKIGGFAVSGRTSTKGTTANLINLFPENYFIGHESGLLTSGSFNSFFGYNAGYSNIGGSRNIFIGYESGFNNEESDNNLFLGNQAGYTNTSGNNNIFMGNGSGFSNESADHNIFIGYQAGFNNTTGDENTFLGYQSGFLNEEGFYNVYIGYQSGYVSGVDGIYKNYRNVFIGPFAGYYSSGVSESVYIGYDAGRYNVNGSRNTFVGGNAGENNTNGTDNSFFGNGAGESTTGTGNTYIGSSAGWSDTASFRCTYVGVNAGQAMVTKSYRNTFIGGWAGKNKTGGSYNTLIGFGANEDGVDSERNVMIGTFAGESTTGDYNVFLGYEAGKTNNSNKNTFIGYQAGENNNTGGDGNVFIGYQAGQNADVTDKLYIDNSNTSSPLIYGDFSTGNEMVRINGDLDITGTLTGGKSLKSADYVFDKSYQVISIEEHAIQMWKKKHLPALLGENEIKENGYDMVERREQILEELEIAHIYIEQLNNRINKLETENNNLIEKVEKIDHLEQQNQSLKDRIDRQQGQINQLMLEIEKLKN